MFIVWNILVGQFVIQVYNYMKLKEYGNINFKVELNFNKNLQMRVSSVPNEPIRMV